MTNLRDTLTRKGDLFKETINDDGKKAEEEKSKYDTFLYEMGPIGKKKNVVYFLKVFWNCQTRN